MWGYIYTIEGNIYYYCLYMPHCGFTIYVCTFICLDLSFFHYVDLILFISAFTLWLSLGILSFYYCVSSHFILGMIFDIRMGMISSLANIFVHIHAFFLKLSKLTNSQKKIQDAYQVQSSSVSCIPGLYLVRIMYLGLDVFSDVQGIIYHIFSVNMVMNYTS